MKIAHERDITFNQLVEEALREAIKTYAPELDVWPFSDEEESIK
jgi:hypothetical protein